MTGCISIELRTVYDEDPDPSYLEQEGWEDRLRQYRDGVFTFVGVYALAKVLVNDTVQDIRSGGLWGIESDSGDDYMAEVEAEELDDLRTTLAEMGFHDLPTAIR